MLVAESDFGAGRVWRVHEQARQGARGRGRRRLVLGCARSARHRAGCARRGGRLGRRTDDRRRDAGCRPQPGRHLLFRCPPHTRRHARQDDPGQRCADVAAWTAMLAVLSGGHRAGAETAPAALSTADNQRRNPSMRILNGHFPLFALVLRLAFCNVSKEGNAVTVQYDQNTAENAARGRLATPRRTSRRTSATTCRRPATRSARTRSAIRTIATPRPAVRPTQPRTSRPTIR